jgi:hypothetical protein
LPRLVASRDDGLGHRVIERLSSGAREALAPREFSVGRLVEFERTRIDVACSFVDVDRDACLCGLALDQLQRDRDRALAEQALAGPDRQREDPDALLVDEVVLEQCLEQIRAAVNLDLGAVLALEPGDRFRDVARDQRRAIPVDLLQRARGDVLAGAIEVIGDRAVGLGPCAAKIPYVPRPSSSSYGLLSANRLIISASK